MRTSEAIKFYSRKDVASYLVQFAQDREAVPRFGEGFGKRPDVLEFPSDVEKLAWKGATSFHISEEHWKDPMQLDQTSTKKQLDELRSGWDLIIDVDAPWFFVATATAKLIVEALKYFSVTCFVKFSGGKGWHICVPAKAFPTFFKGKPIEQWFPEMPHTIISYLMDFIKPHLEDEIIMRAGGDLKRVAESLNMKKEEFYTENGFKPNILSQMDIQLASPRHLFRSPYSLHEKSGLVSLPIDSSKIGEFQKDWAKPDDLKEIKPYIDESLVREGEAAQLAVQAFDWKDRKETAIEKLAEKAKKSVGVLNYEGKIPEEMFADCIKHLLKGGMEDGRKRALTILLNFLKCVGWDWVEIEERVRRWNETNSPPIKTGYLVSQLNWHKAHREKIPPPNCDSSGWYSDIGVPKELLNMKNPLAWTIKRVKKSKTIS